MHFLAPVKSSAVMWCAYMAKSTKQQVAPVQGKTLKNECQSRMFFPLCRDLWKLEVSLNGTDGKGEGA